MKVEIKKRHEVFEETFDWRGGLKTQRKIFRRTANNQTSVQLCTAVADPWVCAWVRREGSAWLSYKVLLIRPYRNHLIANQYATLPLSEQGRERSMALTGVGPWSFDPHQALLAHTRTLSVSLHFSVSLSLSYKTEQDNIITKKWV